MTSVKVSSGASARRRKAWKSTSVTANPPRITASSASAVGTDTVIGASTSTATASPTTAT